MQGDLNAKNSKKQLRVPRLSKEDELRGRIEKLRKELAMKNEELSLTRQSKEKQREKNERMKFDKDRLEKINFWEKKLTRFQKFIIRKMAFPFSS